MLGDKGKAKIAETSRVKTLNSGEVLYRQGVQGDRMFLLLEGLLSSIYTLSGYEGSAKVEQIESGRHFGEECVLGDNPPFFHRNGGYGLRSFGNREAGNPGIGSRRRKVS